MTSRRTAVGAALGVADGDATGGYDSGVDTCGDDTGVGDAATPGSTPSRAAFSHDPIATARAIATTAPAIGQIPKGDRRGAAAIRDFSYGVSFKSIASIARPRARPRISSSRLSSFIASLLAPAGRRAGSSAVARSPDEASPRPCRL